jgi:hypothetical protein
MAENVSRGDYLWEKFVNLKKKLLHRIMNFYQGCERNGLNEAELKTENKIYEMFKQIQNVQELIFCIQEAFIPYWKDGQLNWEEMKNRNKLRGLLLNFTSENEEFPMSEDYECLLNTYANCFCVIYTQ